MKQILKRTVETLTKALAALITLAPCSWASPPPPPAPPVPVGGSEVTVATALLIVGYGIYKSRR